MAIRQTPRIRIASISWATITTVSLLTLVCGAYLFGSSIHARYIFSELETLQLGHSTFEDAQRLASKIGAEPAGYGTCDRSYCAWHKRIDNRQLPRWWRGSGEVFAVGFTVKDSIAVRKNTGFGIDGEGIDAFSPSSVGLVQQEHWGRGETLEPVQAGWRTSERFRYYEFMVKMTPRASTEDRRRYTAFNYGCLWRYKGCKDARELLPTADPFPFDP